MASRKICTPNSVSAFSLIEVLVVLAVVAAIASLTALMTIGDYRAVSFRSDRARIVNALEEAREQSMHGSCFGNSCTGPVSHGVHIETGAYTIFQGSTYSPADSVNETVEGSKNETLSGFTDVVFEALSGRATAIPKNTLTLVDASGKSSVITVGSEGRISWTN